MILKLGFLPTCGRLTNPLFGRVTAASYQISKSGQNRWIQNSRASVVRCHQVDTTTSPIQPKDSANRESGNRESGNRESGNRESGSPTLSSMFAVHSSFTELGISQVTADHLASIGLHIPTNAQAVAIPLLLQGLSLQAEYAAAVREAGTTVSNDEDAELTAPNRSPDDVNDVLMLAAETGSGKTLAYLLPYVQVVQTASVNLKAIILVPSRELCDQISAFLQNYFVAAPRHVILAGGAPPDPSDMRDVRIVIATPGALLQHLRVSPRPDISDKFIVVDEADMLLTGSFLYDLERVLDQPGMKPFATRRNGPLRSVNANRLLFVGATFPHWVGTKVRSIITWMKRRYPEMRSIQTADVHRRSDRLQSRWFHIPSELNRVNELTRILCEDADSHEKVMVFFAKAETAANVCGNLLSGPNRDTIREKFGGAVQLHKLIRRADRIVNVHAFQESDVRLLFCTDLASRGLHFGHVTRVIEFDFASNVVAYLHRIGRTARAGAAGKTDHFYDNVSRSLADAIRLKTETEAAVVDSIFSRNRSFRRKLKKQQKKEAIDNQENIGPLTEHATIEGVEIDEMDDEERERWNK